MLFRSVALTLFTAGSILPAPSTSKYRIEQSLSQEIDASAAGGAKQKIAFTTRSFVTVTLADSAGGKTIRVLVDSIRGDSATPIPSPVLDSARGTVFSGFVERTGRLTGLQPTGSNPAGAQVQGLLSDFFPWVRPGLKAGQAWADTTAKTTGTGADSVTVRRVSTYKTAAGETRESRKAVRVMLDFTSSVAGTQPTPNGPARIEGTGQGSGVYFVSTDGRYLGGSWQQQSSLTISGSFATQPLPITISQKTTVSTLK